MFANVANTTDSVLMEKKKALKYYYSTILLEYCKNTDAKLTTKTHI